MIPRRPSRFDDLVRRQLDLFAEDERELLDDVREAEAAYRRAPKDESEEAYGDFQDELDAVAEALGEVRDTYAATLDEANARAYEQVFDRLAGKRFPPLRGRL